MKYYIFLLIFLLASCLPAMAQTQVPMANSPSLSANYGNSLRSAIASIGSTPMMLRVNTNTNCSTALTVPATLILKFEGGAKITKQTGCTIQFQGIGLNDPTSESAVFSGFAAGDITFNGKTDHPKKISSNLWNDASVTTKLSKAIAAFPSQAVTIVAYSGQLTGQVVVTSGKTLFFTEGTYTNITSANTLFILNDNTDFGCASAAKTFIEESSNNSIEVIRASGVTAYPFNGTNSDIKVHDCTFKGRAETAVNSALSAVFLGNVKRGRIYNNTFYYTHGFAAFVGAFGTAGYTAEDSSIDHNNVVGPQTQAIGAISGRNVKIDNNILTEIQPSASAPFASIIDIEPNDTQDICYNIEVTNNTIDGRNAQQNWNGIVYQAANSAGGCIGGRISGNNVLGTTGEDAEGSRLIVGITVQGSSGVIVQDNYVRGPSNSGLATYTSRNLTVTGNVMHNIGGGGNPGVSIMSTAGSYFGGNIFESPAEFAADDSIVESEDTATVNTSGTTVTITSGLRLYRFMAGLTVNINGVDYAIASVNGLNAFTLTSSARTQTGVKMTLKFSSNKYRSNKRSSTKLLNTGVEY